MVVDLIDEDEPYFFTAAVCFNPAACSGKKVQIAYCAADASGEQVRVCDVDVGTSTVTQLYRLGPAESLGTWDRLTNTTGAHSFKAHPKSFSLMVTVLPVLELSRLAQRGWGDNLGHRSGIGCQRDDCAVSTQAILTPLDVQGYS